jgi:DNA-binding HxlR family transcriptional regulator
VKEDITLFGKCPYETAQKIFSGKWAIVVIHHLAGKTLRFGELHRKIPGITQTTLTKQLRILEDYGLVERYVYPVVPPKVEYTLTNIGNEFVPVLEQFEKFGDKYIKFINNDKM